MVGGAQAHERSGGARAVGFCGLGPALVVGGAGALAVSVAPLLPVAGPASAEVRGGSWPAALTVAACLLLVVLLAGRAARRGGSATATGLLVGAGAVGVGLAVLDLQLFVRALDANRIELLRPTTAAQLRARAGACVVLAGHLGLVVAGVLAALARRVAVETDAEVPVTHRVGPWVTTVAVGAALVAAVSLLLPPLTSTDPVIVVAAVVQSGVAIAVGSVVVGVSVLLVAAAALVAGSVPWAAGALGGTALAVGSLELTRVVGAATGAGLTPGVGALLGTAATVVLGAVGAVLGPLAVRRETRGSRGADGEVTAVLPGSRLLQAVAAGTGLLAGVLAVIAALAPVLTVSDAARAVPEIAQTRVLLVGGVVLAAACAGMAAGLGALARPVVAVVWLALPLGAGAVLQAVLTATQVSGVGWGAGAFVAVAAVVAGLACAVAAGLGGAVERDDVDLTELDAPAAPLAWLLGGAAVAAALGLLLPLYTGPGYRPPGVLARVGEWGWDTWSLVVVAIGVVVSVVVAARARPARGAAVLVGAALVLAVHLAGWPLTSGRVPEATVGAGVVAGAVGLVGLVVAAVGLAAIGLARR